MEKKLSKKRLLPYFFKYKWQILLYILLSIFASGLMVFETILFANIIETLSFAANGQPDLYQKTIYMFLFLIGITCIIKFAWWLQIYVYKKYSIRIMADINNDLERQSFKLNSQCYANHDTGTFVQRIINDPENLVENLSDLTDLIITLLSSISVIIYIMTLNLWISLCIIVILIISYVIEYFRVKYFRKIRKISKQKRDKIHSLTTEIVRSSDDIKSLGLENVLNESYRGKYNDYKNYQYRTSLNCITLATFRSFIANIGILAILILGIVFMEKGLITFATFMIIYSNDGEFLSIIRNLSSIFNIFVEINVSKERIFQLFDEVEFVTEKFGTETLPVPQGGCEIKFENVTYSYKEYDFENNTTKKQKKKDNNKEREITLLNTNKVFENLNFQIEKNTTVSFVGKSGSGKSTILKLMSKMIDADEGQVCIDGKNINTLTKDSIRNNIALVNQFPYIFDATIKENLLMVKQDATDEEIKQVLHEASLDEFISSLPKGIETKVGEAGIKLSGGQRQRLAIARALLKKSSIILFDESTSSLDNFAQEDIKNSINNLKGKTTVVVVAHRLSTIRNVDKIYFLNDGRITDSGTFDELYSKNETFKKMFLVENI